MISAVRRLYGLSKQDSRTLLNTVREASASARYAEKWNPEISSKSIRYGETPVIGGVINGYAKAVNDTISDVIHDKFCSPQLREALESARSHMHAAYHERIKMPYTRTILALCKESEGSTMQKARAFISGMFNYFT